VRLHAPGASDPGHASTARHHSRRCAPRFLSLPLPSRRRRASRAAKTVGSCRKPLCGRLHTRTSCDPSDMEGHLR
jgi:hypothetical protein